MVVGEQIPEAGGLVNVGYNLLRMQHLAACVDEMATNYVEETLGESKHPCLLRIVANSVIFLSHKIQKPFLLLHCKKNDHHENA